MSCGLNEDYPFSEKSATTAESENSLSPSQFGFDNNNSADSNDDDENDFIKFYCQDSTLQDIDMELKLYCDGPQEKKARLDDSDIISARSENTVESASSITASLNQDNRLNILMNLPNTICSMMNAGNVKQLCELIYLYFAPNCVLKTPTLIKEIYGVDSIIGYFTSISNSVPDLVMMCTPATLNFRVITVLCTCTGTKVSTDSLNYMYDVTKHGRDETNVYHQVREKAKRLLMEGKLICFVSKSYLHFILNTEMTYVEKFITVRKTLDVVESKVT